MVFETVRDAIVTILGNAAAGRYRVEGYQEQGVAASRVKDSNRLVSVFYQAGDFPKSAGSMRGINRHDVTYAIELSAAKAAKGSAASPAAVIAATLQADRALDELWGIIYNVLMDVRNYNLGQANGVVASRWVSGFEKGNVNRDGDLAIVTARGILTVSMDETVTGDSLPAAATGYEVTIDLDGDAVEKTGVAEETPIGD